MDTSISTGRHVARLTESVQAMEGAGVEITRVMPIAGLGEIDPFLLLDEIRSDKPNAYLAGFPPHPHRGIETVTYMLAGRMHHRDSTGGDGVIGPGDVQWMTAGRGIVHAEMPEQTEGLMWGFQLWINLPSSEKMTTSSSYIELASDTIPEVHAPGSVVRVISGEHPGRRGPAPKRATLPTYLDVSVRSGGEVSISVPTAHSAFAYLFDGAAEIAGVSAESGQTAILGGEGPIRIASAPGARLLLVCGKPLDEPIHRAGPFVMASERDLKQAFDDLRDGRFLEPA